MSVSSLAGIENYLVMQYFGNDCRHNIKISRANVVILFKHYQYTWQYEKYGNKMVHY